MSYVGSSQRVKAICLPSGDGAGPYSLMLGFWLKGTGVPPVRETDLIWNGGLALQPSTNAPSA
ncbi:MAG TPA: hypothetical protein VF032_01760 [Thermoleophilaceae bacterium]